MKIGILGAPGAGKSAFAKGLAKELGDAHVVDNYVQRLQKSTDLALGPFAGYTENLMVAGVREAARLKVNDAKYQIAVGTIMDTMVYVMVHSDVSLHNNAAEKMQVYADARAVVNCMTLWYNYTWDYDVTFFLPHQGEPKSQNLADYFPHEMSKAYPAVLETFFVTTFGLDGTTKERVKVAREVIDILERDEAARADQEDESSEDPQRSVRHGVNPGEDIGDPPESVPDVSVEDRS